MGFLGDYTVVFLAIIAVINGVLAVFSTHYPFKTPVAKFRFILIVLSLSVGAIMATFYSQYLVVSRRTQEREHLDFTRETLSGFIAKGNEIINACPSDVNDPAAHHVLHDWEDNTEAFLSKELGNSYVIRFRDPIGIDRGLSICPDWRFWEEAYRRIVRLEEFSHEMPRQ
jgi:hypothetical protein